MDALNAFFKDKFYFETDHYEIPSEKWQTGLNKKISEFIYDHDSPDCLILIYYAGHAYPGVETGSLKFAGFVYLSTLFINQARPQQFAMRIIA